jgi:hypothetical protein
VECPRARRCFAATALPGGGGSLRWEIGDFICHGSWMVGEGSGHLRRDELVLAPDPVQKQLGEHPRQRQGRRLRPMVDLDSDMVQLNWWLMRYINAVSLWGKGLLLLIIIFTFKKGSPVFWLRQYYRLYPLCACVFVRVSVSSVLFFYSYEYTWRMRVYGFKKKINDSFYRLFRSLRDQHRRRPILSC